MMKKTNNLKKEIREITNSIRNDEIDIDIRCQEVEEKRKQVVDLADELTDDSHDPQKPEHTELTDDEKSDIVQTMSTDLEKKVDNSHFYPKKPENKPKTTHGKSPKISLYIKNHLMSFVLAVAAGVVVTVIGAIFIK